MNGIQTASTPELLKELKRRSDGIFVVMLIGDAKEDGTSGNFRLRYVAEKGSLPRLLEAVQKGLLRVADRLEDGGDAHEADVTVRA